MKKNKAYLPFLDYGSIVLSFFIFMLAWFNGNLTDMPWYGLLLTIVFSIATALAIFSMLNLRRHRRVAVAFAIMLLILSVPSAMHRHFGVLSVPEIIMFYAKQVYLPILGGTALFLLLKKKEKLWQILLRWGSWVYAVLGATIGTIILYTELTRNTAPEMAEMAEITGEAMTTLAILTVVGIVLAIVGLIINPLYVLWRNSEGHE